MLAAAAFIVAASAPCDSRREIVTAPPAVLPAADASTYPNGVETTIAVTVDASGKVVSVKPDAAAPLRSAMTAWAKRVTFVPADTNCMPADVNVDASFYPPASGIVGRPMVVGSVDLGKLTYGNGPGNCKTVPSTGDGYQGYVDEAFSGNVAGQLVAVAILRCEYNGHGFDSQAQLFAIEGGKARRLGILGSGGMMSSDSPLPPWPGGWIHLSFADGKLYVDLWDYAHRCDATRDWASSTYTVRDGKLVLEGVLGHHRHGIGVACD